MKHTKFELNYVLELTLLAAIWGSSFLFMRIATPEFGPIVLIFLRSAIAAMVLVPFLFSGKQYRAVAEHWPLFLWLGIVTVAIPFTLFSYVLLSLSAGNASLLNATTSIFSCMIAWIWLKESLRTINVAGLVLGFSGVFLLSAPSSGNYLENLLPVSAALVATMLYAYGTCYARLKLGKFRPSTSAAGGQIFAALVLLPLGIVYWPETSPSLLAWGSALALGALCTSFALIIYFHLLKFYGVTKTVSVTYLIPFFGILWGVIFLEETVSPQMLLGGVMILLGVAMSTNVKVKSK